MSVQWLRNHFTFATMGASDMILARFVEVLREFNIAPTLPTILGGEARILYCPLGVNLSLIKAPAMFCTQGLNSRVPSPGLFADRTVVRAVLRFEMLKPSDVSAPWTPSIASLVNKIRTAAASNPHLNFTPTEDQVPGYSGEPLPLATHMEPRDVLLENVLTSDGNLSTSWDLIVEFEYQHNVNRAGRPEALAKNNI